MKILSMTATFGKLQHQTLELKPGMNIIEAPNEWGKSTWCAFLMAMLYGIDTSERTTKTHLAPKTHYEPWSGQPMSGRMELLWNGRAVTIERQSKGKTPMGIFRAYETDTGLEIPELTADNCGETLLGVERSVFQRSGFLRLSDLPIDQDDALRRRLNALVTTGDESGTADTLQKTLKELKNHCRFNKKGLLPQAEAQADSLQDALRQIEALAHQKQQYLQRQQLLLSQRKDLENHRQALLYSANLTYSQKLAAAQVAKDTAENTLLQAQNACRELPSSAWLQDAAAKVQTLQAEKSDLHLKAQMLPGSPSMPETSDVFRGLDPEQAVAMAKEDAAQAELLEAKSGKFPFVGLLMSVAGAICAAAIPVLGVRIGGLALAAAGIALLAMQFRKKKSAQKALSALQAKYRGVPSGLWETDALRFRDQQTGYQAQLTSREAALRELNRQLTENENALRAITGEQSPAQFLQFCTDAREKHRQAEDARVQLRRAEELLQALQSTHKAVEPPKYEDTLTCSEQETQRRLIDLDSQLHQLHGLIGNCQGQAGALGDPDVLQKQLQEVQSRIQKLEDTYAALELAQNALTAATQELQRRFAPRISQRAQELLTQMTGGRYDRLTLDSEFTVHTGAEAEDATQTPLWRSDGTADQLYIALRLAVSEELTPDAPLILDDALVRFDDTRLTATLEILKEASQRKQVILFTCQSRESALIN